MNKLSLDSVKTRFVREPQSGISCGSLVANSVDTLKMSFWVDWSSSNFLYRLEALKKQVQDTDDISIPVNFFGSNWNLMRTGTTHYNYRLVRGDVFILLNHRKFTGSIPTFRLEIGSVSSWSPGYLHVYLEVLKLIEGFGGAVVKERISEIHLASDLMGVCIRDFPFSNQDHWISRAKLFSTYYESRKLTGITAGKGDLMLRVYDKKLELSKNSSKQDFFHKIWKLSETDLNVTRVEFQLRRPILREFEPIINTISDLQCCLDSLWHYCCEKWCRFTDKPVDRNHHQSRSTLHELWSLLLKVKWTGKGYLKRVKKYFVKDLRRLRKQSVGFLMTISAMISQTTSIDDIVALSQNVIENDMRMFFKDEPNEFLKRIHRKINDSIVDSHKLSPGFENSF